MQRTAGDETETAGTPAGGTPRVPEVGAGAKVGRYVLLERVGHGGMGVVWSAYDPRLDRRIALKLVRPSPRLSTAALELEARALARLSHPNIVAIHDVASHGEAVVLAMELVPGVTLAQWLRQRRGWREVIAPMVAAARALAAAHGAGVVHGDFKPANVLVAADARDLGVKVVDFGLARIGGPQGGSDPVDDGDGGAAVRGTPAYLAPELLGGTMPTALSDQYAFGVTLFEALTGALPFEIHSFTDAARVHHEGAALRWPPRARVPAWLRELVARMIAARPQARVSSMEAVARQLERGRSRARRRMAAGAGLALAGVLALGLHRVNHRCDGAAAEVADAWNDEIAASIAAGLAQQFGELPQHAWLRARGRLDGIAASIAAAATTACHLGADDPLRSRRRRCIDRGLAALSAQVEMLSAPGSELPRVALRGGSRVEPTLDCRDADALILLPAAADDPAAREQTLEVERELAAAALRDDRELPRMGESLAPLEARAAALDDASLLAEVIELRGRAALGAGDFAAARADYTRALAAAEVAGDVRRQALVWLEIATVLREAGGSDDGADLAIERAAAAITRLRDPPELRVQLHMSRARLAARRGDSERAVEEVDVAFAIAKRMGASDVQHMVQLSRVTILLNRGRIDEAAAAADDALALVRSEYGDDHPFTAAALGARANTWLASVGRNGTQADYAGIRAAYDEAERLLLRWDIEHGTRAVALVCNRCHGFGHACRRDDALDSCQRCAQQALALGPTTVGATGLGTALSWLGPLDADAGRATALAMVQRWGAPKDAAAATVFVDAATLLDRLGQGDAAWRATEVAAPHADDRDAARVALLTALWDRDPVARQDALQRVMLLRERGAFESDNATDALLLARATGDPGDREALQRQRERLDSACRPALAAAIDRWLAASAAAPPGADQSRSSPAKK